MTRQPDLCRRRILAGAAAIVPAALMLPVHRISAAPPQSPTPLQIAMEEYDRASALAEHLNAIEATTFAEKIEPHRQAWVQAVEAAKKTREDIANAYQDSPEYNAAAIAHFVDDDAASVIDRFVSAVRAARKLKSDVDNDPLLLAAIEAENKAFIVGQDAENSAAYQAKSDAAAEADEAKYEILDRVQITRPATVQEFFAKIEFLALQNATDACTAADFLDLVVDDLAPLIAQDYRPSPETTALERNWNRYAHLGDEA